MIKKYIHFNIEFITFSVCFSGSFLSGNISVLNISEGLSKIPLAVNVDN